MAIQARPGSIRRIARGRWLSGAGAAAAAFLPEAAALAPEGPVVPGLPADSGGLPSPPGFSDRGASGWRLSARRRPGQGSSVQGRSSVRRWHRIQRQSPVRWRNPIQGRRPSRSPARGRPPTHRWEKEKISIAAVMIMNCTPEQEGAMR